ncbi:DUF4064 domain-containing protein [Staphylococcus canis]|uniref:DUF4064 domain-containing protein n=1 Tax=Staphylococcus canis TaxID=2724942 RepID=A0ABS0TAP6_9STAP|nr:DUF4064 domain-containing protein [Staphylococcus canis]MBI5975818.1 DUF4064 domain-containing protein [Staphylococcus canis]
MADRYVYNNENDPNRFNNHNHNHGYIKRTAEKALTWIGIILHLIWTILAAVGVSFLPKLAQNKDVQQALNEQGQNANEIANQSGSFASLLIPFGIPLLLALIAVFLFRKRVLAGVLLILAALIGFFLSGSLIAAILWLIAGIMLLARKPKNGVNHHNGGRPVNPNHDRNRNDVERDRNDLRHNGQNDFKSKVNEEKERFQNNDRHHNGQNDFKSRVTDEKDHLQNKAQDRFDDFKNK